MYSPRYCFQVSNGASLKHGLDIAGFDEAKALSYRILVSLSLCVHRDVGGAINVSRSAVQQIVHDHRLVIVE